MMTPQEGSKFCIQMAGYGIRHDVVQAIQENALDSLLNRLLAPTIISEKKDGVEIERPITVEERIQYVLNRENRLTQTIAKVNALAITEANTDDETFMVHEAAGGNIDDAYSLGVNDGEIYLARELRKIINT